MADLLQMVKPMAMACSAAADISITEQDFEEEMAQFQGMSMADIMGIVMTDLPEGTMEKVIQCAHAVNSGNMESAATQIAHTTQELVQFAQMENEEEEEEENEDGDYEEEKEENEGEKVNFEQAVGAIQNSLGSVLNSGVVPLLESMPDTKQLGLQVMWMPEVESVAKRFHLSVHVVNGRLTHLASQLENAEFQHLDLSAKIQAGIDYMKLPLTEGEQTDNYVQALPPTNETMLKLWNTFNGFRKPMVIPADFGNLFNVDEIQP